MLARVCTLSGRYPARFLNITRDMCGAFYLILQISCTDFPRFRNRNFTSECRMLSQAFFSSYAGSLARLIKLTTSFENPCCRFWDLKIKCCDPFPRCISSDFHPVFLAGTACHCKRPFHSIFYIATPGVENDGWTEILHCQFRYLATSQRSFIHWP